MTIRDNKFMERRPKLSLFDLIRMGLAIFFLGFSTLKNQAIFGFKNCLGKQHEKAIKLLVLVNYGFDVIEYLVFTSFLFDGAFGCVTVQTIFIAGIRSVKPVYLLLSIISVLFVISYVIRLASVTKKLSQIEDLSKNFIIKETNSELVKKSRVLPQNQDILDTEASLQRVDTLEEEKTNIEDETTNSRSININRNSQQAIIEKEEPKKTEKKRTVFDKEATLKHIDTNRLMVQLALSDLDIYNVAKMKPKAIPRLLIFGPLLFQLRLLICTLVIPAAQNSGVTFLSCYAFFELISSIINAYNLFSSFSYSNIPVVLTKTLHNVTVFLFCFFSVISNSLGSEGDSLLNKTTFWLLVAGLYLEYVFAVLVLLIGTAKSIYHRIRKKKIVCALENLLFYKAPPPAVRKRRRAAPPMTP